MRKLITVKQLAAKAIGVVSVLLTGTSTIEKRMTAVLMYRMLSLVS
jgi:hypothetical protein